MINCPNSKPVSKHVSQCSVLVELGVNFIAAEARSSSPCKVCKTQWVSGQVPTKDSLTDAMRLVVQANGRIELPTITEQATSFMSSIIKWAGDGFKNVPEIYYNQRVNKCRSNDCGMYEEGRCNACGCFVEAKARFSHEKCPSNMWEELPPEIMNNVPQGCGSCGKK